MIKVGKDLCEYKLNCKPVKKSRNYDETVYVMERLEKRDVVGGSLAKNIIPDTHVQPGDENTISITREEYGSLKECKKQLETIKLFWVVASSDLGRGTLMRAKDDKKGKRRGGWECLLRGLNK